MSTLCVMFCWSNFPPACHLSAVTLRQVTSDTITAPNLLLLCGFKNSFCKLTLQSDRKWFWVMSDPDFSLFNQTFVDSSLMSLKRCDEYLIEMISFLPSEPCWVKRTELILRGVWNKRISTAYAMVKWWDNIKITVKTMGGKNVQSRFIDGLTNK